MWGTKWDHLRNKSWKPECVGSFNMAIHVKTPNTFWLPLVFYPEPEARDEIYQYPPIYVKTQKYILASMIYFDSDMSKSTNTVVYFD